MTNAKPKMNAAHTWDFFATYCEKQNTILGKIIAISCAALASKNWAEATAQCESALCDLADYLHATDFQTAFFAAVFYFSCVEGKDCANFEDILEFFSAKKIMILERKKEILQMQNLGLILIRGSRRILRRHFQNESEEDATNFCEQVFAISDSVSDAILCEKPLPKKKTIQTPKDFLESLAKITREMNAHKGYEIFESVLALESECLHKVKTILNVKEKIPQTNFRLLFYFVCYDGIFSRSLCSLYERVSQVAEDSYECNLIFRDLLCDDESENPLAKNSLIEIHEAKIAEDAVAQASCEGLDLMFGSDAALYKNSGKKTELFSAKKIAEKKLYFSEKTLKELSRIKNAICQKNFSLIQSRLKKCGMASGIAVLFYGAPGTGKTESVLQMARESGRDIFHVDISQSKTMWYGESPKLVKKIFKKYKSFCDDAKRQGKEIPILLFNEADAVISKRKELAANFSECDKESNSILNVLLEEMEKLDGIMFATTNLQANMDEAFERRFLFKVEFQKPDAKTCAKIWKEKLGCLSQSQAQAIAECYDFSGGEIDNICRKAQLEEVLSGKKITAQKIRLLCQTERIGGNEKRVGFVL